MTYPTTDCGILLSQLHLIRKICIIQLDYENKFVLVIFIFILKLRTNNFKMYSDYEAFRQAIHIFRLLKAVNPINTSGG